MPTRKPKAKTVPVPDGGKYPSSIILGKEYTHPRSGITGHATSLTFMETACELVQLEHLDPVTRRLVHTTVDAEQCVLAEDGTPVTGQGLKGNHLGIMDIPARPGMP